MFGIPDKKKAVLITVGGLFLAAWLMVALYESRTKPAANHYEVNSMAVSFDSPFLCI